MNKTSLFLAFAMSICFAGSALAVCDNAGDCDFIVTIINQSSKPVSYGQDLAVSFFTQNGSCTSGACNTTTIQPGAAITLNSDNGHNSPGAAGGNYYVTYTLNSILHMVSCHKGSDDEDFIASVVTSLYPSTDSFAQNYIPNNGICSFTDTINQ